MNKQISISIAVTTLIIGGAFYLSSQKKGAELPLTAGVNQALAAKFEILKQNGNSSCYGSYFIGVYKNFIKL